MFQFRNFDIEMELKTIQKNEASLKSHTSKGNIAKRMSLFIMAFFFCTTLSRGQTWNLTPTMTAKLDSLGVLTVSTTATSEAMPDWNFNYGTVPPYFSYVVRSVVIQEKVTTIGNEAFYFQHSLMSVAIPNSVTTIGNGAFKSCESLTSVAIPNSVTTIGQVSFMECVNLISVTIGNSVTSIGDGAFSFCTSLKNVTVKWTTPLSVPASIFRSVPDSVATLHVPSGAKALYQAVDVWKDFGTIKETAIIPELTHPTGSDGKGSISLNLHVPSSATLTGSFQIQFPAGMTLDQDVTKLTDGLAGGFSLSFTSKGNNTWLIEIKPKTTKSTSEPAEYKRIMDIAYKVDKDVSNGAYEATITSLDFTANDGTKIQEDLLTVAVPVTQNPTVVETVDNSLFRAWFVGNVLRVESPQAELITVYSIVGTQLYSTVKNVGMTEIPLPSQNGSIFIIKGNASGTVKVIKQN